MAITFHSQTESFIYKHRRATAAWLQEVIKTEGAECSDISILFCNDEYILQVNNQYLEHNYFTDIITFDYSEKNSSGKLVVSGDLTISVDTVLENSKIFESTFENELHRVIVHGVLHLLGYNDKTESEVKIMRSKEDNYLKLFETKQTI